jgi:hypothetical protein
MADDAGEKCVGLRGIVRLNWVLGLYRMPFASRPTLLRE